MCGTEKMLYRGFLDGKIKKCGKFLDELIGGRKSPGKLALGKINCRVEIVKAVTLVML
jgi:hypothetical protein